MPNNPLDRPEWPVAPTLPTKSEDAKVELYKQQLAEVLERRKEFQTARHESHVAIEAGQIEVIKGAVERARDTAKYMQTAASAIAVLYTGVAALAFKVDSDRPLPVRGVIPILFLGAAIVFSTVYLAWFSSGVALRPFPLGIDATQLRVDRIKWFNDWMSRGVLNKAWALRVATYALAAGLVFLAAPFVPITAKSSAKVAAKPTVPTAKAGRVAVQAAGAVDNTASTTSSTLVPWPVPPGRDLRFSSILYQAQVNEVAQQRAAAAKPTADAPVPTGFKISEIWIWLSALAVALTIAGVVWYQQTRGSLGRALVALAYKPPEPAGAPLTHGEGNAEKRER